MKECKRSAIQSQKVMKETPTRARRLCKEMQVYWKRFEKVEKEHRKRAEKEALEQRKMDHELAEVNRKIFANQAIHQLHRVINLVKHLALPLSDEKTAEKAELPYYSNGVVCSLYGT